MTPPSRGSSELHPDTVWDTVTGAAPGDHASALVDTARVAQAGSPPPAAADEASGAPLVEPQLRVEEYFRGPLWADGVLIDRGGSVRRRFHVDMEGRWEGPRGTLHERFVFDDGERQQRTWSLRCLPPQQGVRRYEAQAGDVVGTAQGHASGHELRWRYVLALPLGSRVWHVHMDDRMYLLNDKVLINRTDMRKFGITMARLFITFGKP